MNWKWIRDKTQNIFYHPKGKIIYFFLKLPSESEGVWEKLVVDARNQVQIKDGRSPGSGGCCRRNCLPDREDWSTILHNSDCWSHSVRWTFPSHSNKNCRDIIYLRHWQNNHFWSNQTGKTISARIFRILNFISIIISYKLWVGVFFFSLLRWSFPNYVSIYHLLSISRSYLHRAVDTETHHHMLQTTEERGEHSSTEDCGDCVRVIDKIRWWWEECHHQWSPLHCGIPASADQPGRGLDTNHCLHCHHRSDQWSYYRMAKFKST